METPLWMIKIVMLAAIIFIPGVKSFASAAGQSGREQPPRSTNDRPSGATDQRDSDGCTKRFDRFRNRDTVMIEPRTIFRAENEELKLGASAAIEKDVSSAPREVELLFDSTTGRLRYGNSAEVRFIVDGKRKEGGTAYKMGGFAMRQVNEKLRLTMPASRFLEIIGGREVEMQIGETEITLRGEDLQRLKDFAACAGLRD
jgi:hypothetical protein